MELRQGANLRLYAIEPISAFPKSVMHGQCSASPALPSWPQNAASELPVGQYQIIQLSEQGTRV